MSSATPDATPAPAPRDSAGGPGRLIRAARERNGLTLDGLATQTRLARGTLDALERDDYATLNEPVYIKGYYRKCAKVLGLDEAELIGAYERQAGPRQPQAPTKLLLAADRGLAKTSRGTGGGSLTWLWAVVAAAALGAGVYFLRGEGSGSATTRSGASTAAQTVLPPAPAAAASETERTSSGDGAGTVAPAPTATTGVPAPGARTAALPQTAAPTSSAAGTSPPRDEPGVAASGAVSATAPVAQTPPVVPREGSLSLNFKGTSWVRIEDADGKTLLSGVIQAGDHQSVHGKPPYSVFLGNAPGVAVDYSGRPFDVAPYTKSNATARFSVPSS